MRCPIGFIIIGTIFIGITFGCKGRKNSSNTNLKEVKNGSFVITCQTVAEINAWIHHDAPKLIEKSTTDPKIEKNLNRRFCVYTAPSNQSIKEGLEIAFADVDVTSGRGATRSDAGVACGELRLNGKKGWKLPKSINKNADPRETLENISFESIVEYLNKIGVEKVKLHFWSESKDKGPMWFASQNGIINKTTSGSTFGVICINNL